MASKQKKSCLDRIIVLVNYRERCEKELYDRLVLKEQYSKQEFLKALKLAKRYNLVNDNRYAEFYVLDKTSTFHGSYGISKHLEKMNIDYKFKIENEIEKAFEYITAHKPRSKNIFQSSVRKLISRGYSVEISVAVAKKFIETI